MITATIKKLGLLGVGLWLTGGIWLAPALAFPGMGVVKSRDNEMLWEGITSRLALLGVNYCVLDSESWQSEQALKGLTVIFLPNVLKLQGYQTASLTTWLTQGGQIIATGPTGELSSPDVKSQLKTLLGASWEFPTLQSLSLKLNPAIAFPSLEPTGLTTPLRGGILVSQSPGTIAATWIYQDNPAAIVTTPQTTFLGWRWGSNAVVSPAFDVAWLKASLSRPGLSAGLSRSGDTVGKPCSSVPNQPPPLPLLPSN